MLNGKICSISEDTSLHSKALCFAGISWFEIDRADVLNAKMKVLTEAQASFSADTNKGMARSISST